MPDPNATYTEEQVAAMKAEIEASLRTKIEAEMKEKLSAEVETALKAQYETLIAKARSEEKDKLYPEITHLKAAAEKAERERVAAQQEAEAKTAELNAKMEELNTKLEEAKAAANKKEEPTVDEKVIKELQDTIEKLTNRVAASEAEKAEAQKKAELETYRTSQLKDLDESMHTFVKGATKEEIDASVVEAKAAFESLQKRYGGVPTPTPSVTKLAEALDKTSEEDIQTLRASKNREAWEKSELRSALGLGGNGRNAMFRK